MNITHVMRTGFATVLCLAVAVPGASAADTLATEPSVVLSAEGEPRPNLVKDPAAVEALSVAPESAASVAELAPTNATSADAVITSGNALPISGFADGDIILGFNAWTVGHAGIMDATRHIALTSSCVWSAVKETPGCVTLEKPSKYRGYDWAYGIWVPKALATQRASARRFCSSQIGERYNLFSAKSDHTQWYCSKLPWAGYSQRAYKDLDANGGYWVTPADLYNDNDTRVFAAAY